MPWLFVAGACIGRLTSDVVDVRVYDDVEALLGVVVLGNLCGSKLLRHDVELCIVYIRRECERCDREGEDPTLLNSPHLTFFPRVPDMTSVQDPRICTFYLGKFSKHTFVAFYWLVMETLIP